MKLNLAVLICMFLAAVTVHAGEQPELKTQKDKVGYALGADMGNTMKENATEVDLELFEQGLKDALSGNKPLMTEEEIKAIAAKVKKDIQTKKEERRKALRAKNKQEGEAFLAENKNKKGVTTLADGLQYAVITEGRPSSSKLKPSDTVMVNYRGTLIDGTEFVSSYKRGKPVNISVASAVKGLGEALRLMNVGAKWQIFLPADLAFGERGAPDGSVGPNATVIFEVELLLVKPGHKPRGD